MSEAGLTRMVPKTIEATAKAIKEILEALIETAAQNRDNKLVSELVEHGKLGKNIDLQICRGFAYQDLDVKLSAQNIPHAIYHDKVSGAIVIATRDMDRDKVLDAKNQLFAEQNRVTLMSHNEFNRLNVGKEINIIRDRTPVEAKVFQQLAKKYGLQIAIEKSPFKDGAVDIYYEKSKKEIAQKLIYKAAYSTVGLSGQKTDFRVGRELEVRSNLVQDIQNDQKDFYLVSKTNPEEYIHFNKEGFHYYRNSALICVESRTRENFLSIANNYIDNIVNPVILQKKEFEVDKEVREKTIRSIKINAPKELFDKRRDDLERAARQLVDYKLSIDNGEQREIPSSFYNNEVSFREFLEIEQVNDDNAKELIEQLDRLEDKEKLLVKNYIKDIFEKVESIEIQTAYVDPEMIREDIVEEIEHLKNENFEINNEGFESNFENMRD